MTNPKQRNQVASIDDQNTNTQKEVSQAIKYNDAGIEDIVKKWGHKPLQCSGMIKAYLANKAE